jgi:hypothetical protein
MKNQPPYFSVRRSRKVYGWYWCIVGANGNEMATSKVYEGRSGKQNARRACIQASKARRIKVEE